MKHRQRAERDVVMERARPAIMERAGVRGCVSNTVCVGVKVQGEDEDTSQSVSVCCRRSRAVYFGNFQEDMACYGRIVLGYSFYSQHQRHRLHLNAKPYVTI
jgi:hypothetical protein